MRGMKIGIPGEIKTNEHRIACTPGGVRSLVAAGNQVLVERGAGTGSGFADREYERVGATIVSGAEEAWSAEMVYKVKEPVAEEYRFLRDDLLLFTYLHLAADLALTQELMKAKTTGVAYETVQIGRRLPLLEPMSEIAGRMSPVLGAYFLGKNVGGSGVLLGGVPGVLPAKVVVFGGGTSGFDAARVASGMEADVTVLELDMDRLRHIDITFHGSIRTLYSKEQNILDAIPSADLVIGAVLIPGALAPKLMTRELLRMMKPGSVFVDIAIDQGGCSETSRPTTHDDPIYTEEGVIHYCVANMPGTYSRTATQALTNVTLPYALKLAVDGLDGALVKAPELLPGVNTRAGKLTNEQVADAHGLAYEPLPG